MKKLTMIIVLVMVAGLFFMSCSKKSTQAKDDRITIGVLFDFLGVESRVKQRDAIIAFAEKNDANVVFQSANNDETLQVRQAENLITQGVDVIALLAVNTEATKPILLACKEAGIPLIVHDRIIENEDVDFFVGLDLDTIGYMQVEYMLNLRQDGNWVLLSGAPTDSLARIWRNAWLERLQPHVDRGSIRIIADEWCDDWDPANGLRHMENILTAHRDNVDIVLVMNDGLGTGVVQALQARGLAGRVPMSGLDGEIVAYQRIVQGTQVMTVAFDDVFWGEALVASAISIAKGEQPATNGYYDNGFKQVPSYLVEPFIVDRANLEERVIQAGLATRAEIFN